MQVDYIVVGIGLAGINFCEQLRANNKNFLVFDNNSQLSSSVAGGLYNPVVLKRFTSVWKAKEQLELALPVYASLETLLNVKLDYKIPVYRKFASNEEQNNWFTASDNTLLSEFLSDTIIKNDNDSLEAPFGFGEVFKTGRIDVKTLIDSYKSYLKKNNRLLEEAFEYDELQIKDDKVQYKNIESERIVFAEGFGVKQNPFFNNLPLVPAKGELLMIHAPELKIDFVLKSAAFLIPLGDDLYIVGATYEWKDLSNNTSLKAKEELLEKLKRLILCDFEVIHQVAGVRPTVKDRRPLVGSHKDYNNMFVLNGLGTRGVMIGPYVAKQLYDFIENNIPLEKEIDIKRFETLM
ncbi:NAD(P)/FAD-dependent oxidoreductase [Seonamhaeicola aphaedonensis]|uniref:Glycine/D-amino acid oxidase-like deaminating enzyme n=1 Tax=Seonamhaeicola aphaedonensis TaxID=1461338 RepID=A0A3D9HLI6_9FLAO|nr:FAD-dependent oxidoreductase [Seonamhaeicola aphaedonensis]RED50343.1 glycine/D-amino acid oxidase-like deaminating enzyme [Seonamhaeicola aphaedonensis]